MRQVEVGHELCELCARHQFCVDPGAAKGIAALGEPGHVGVAMAQDQGTARAEHDVVVQLVAHRFPQLEAEFKKVVKFGLTIVGADDGRVAPSVAAADPALFKHRDLADAVDLGEIVSGRQAMAAAADDDHVIVGFRFRIAPCARPVTLSGQPGTQQRERRIALHAAQPRASRQSGSRVAKRARPSLAMSVNEQVPSTTRSRMA